MGWDRDLVAQMGEILDGLDPTVEAELEAGAEDLRDQLEAGTPVDSGQMVGSWEVLHPEPLVFVVTNTAPYADFVEVDTTGAELAIDQINNDIGDAVSILIEEA